MKKLLLMLCLPVFSFLNAQETIETDRPDQTETPSITPQGFLQIETGLLYESLIRDYESFSHPTVLWRYGLNENFELRIQTELISEKGSAESVTGLAPVEVGFKARLADEKKIVPAISFIGHLSAGRLASSGLETTYWAPSFRFLFQHSLNDNFGIGYNLGAEWNGETPDATGIYTVSASYGFTDKMGGFAEFYGYLNKFATADHRFDTGITYQLNKDLLIDLSAGIGLSEISPDYFISGGISYRFALR